MAGLCELPDRSVTTVARVDLAVVEGRWPFADAVRTSVLAHFEEQQRANPAYFNGPIQVLSAHRVDGGRLVGRFIRTDFASYLYWRRQGFPETGMRDTFGSAILRSAEGHVLLGRQAKGNVNAGLAYLPGGFIDGRDIDTAGRIDIDASVLREVTEETGIAAADLERVPGYRIARAGALISIGIELRSRLSSADLLAAINRHIAADAAPELAEALAVRSLRDVDASAVPAYTRIALASLLPAV